MFMSLQNRVRPLSTNLLIIVYRPASAVVSVVIRRSSGCRIGFMVHCTSSFENWVGASAVHNKQDIPVRKNQPPLAYQPSRYAKLVT
ncbi:hypothetical protein BJ170DRAFT_78798 [Xylariales sp. AK1849]|nr:hypothetical protein BJ170DRAFT_78798 [Xylariales sp. AK1849]